jgi:hypothetical protein
MKRFAALSAALTLVACSASNPGEEGAGPDAGGEEMPGPARLEVEPLPPSTTYSSLPVSGRGPSSGTLIYDVPARGQFSQSLGADGQFCVDVPLQAGGTNRIRFQAIDQAGEYSNPVVVSTVQSGTPPTSPPPDTTNGVRNIARGSTVFTTDTTVAAGSLSLLTDADKSAAVTLESNFGFWTWNYLTIKLTERARIYAVKITTAADCPMEEFEWFLSNLDSPGAGPDTDEPEWSFQQYVTTSATEHLLWPSLAEPTALWLGIDFESSDCGGWTGGVHKLVEIEVFTRDDAPGQTPPPPPNPNPTCASGGVE